MLVAGDTKGCEVEPGAGEEAVEQAGAVLHPLEPGLDQRGELGEAAFGQVGQGSLQVGPDRLDRVELVGIRREPVTVSQSRAAIMAVIAWLT
jgi:hypothetical protein